MIDAIELAECSIYNQGATEIAKALYKNKTLIKLDISICIQELLGKNKIHEEGVKEIAKSLRKNKSLAFLYLSMVKE